MKAVREMDHDGLLLCRIQAETFELSVEKAGTSSEIFIRRFMKSEAAQLLDSGAILYRMYEPQDLLDDIEEQYGASTYGSVKFQGMKCTGSGICIAISATRIAFLLSKCTGL